MKLTNDIRKYASIIILVIALITFVLAVGESLIVSITVTPSEIDAGNSVVVYGNLSLNNGTPATNIDLKIYVDNVLLGLHNFTSNNLPLESSKVLKNSSTFAAGDNYQVNTLNNVIKLAKSSNNTWVFVNLTTLPTKRLYHTLTYDSIQKQFVLFGGQNYPIGYNDETWVYSASTGTWTQKSPGTSPSGRYQHASAYDSNMGVVVLFSGQGSTGFLSDTWWYNLSGNTWTDKTPGTSPYKRTGHKMVYDASNKITILFGGQLNDSYNAET
ncbi:MAG: kelch repeat-containing protein, partial [Nanoarchaeota archaeon]